MASNNYLPLVKIGLSLDEAKVYWLLVSTGSLSAAEIGKQLGVLPNAVYRLTRKLLAKKFLVQLDGWPVKFQALPPEVAITAYLEEKSRELSALKTESLQIFSKNSSKQDTKIRLYTGKNEMFAQYTELAKDAAEEILIYSLGETVPDEIKIANRDALERGINIKFLVQVHNDKNDSLLKSWLKMGLEVRHYPQSGFHLIVFDSKRTLLAVNNPANTNERTTIFFENENFSKAMRAYFLSLWAQALPLT